MRVRRLRISAAHGDLSASIQRLKRLDLQNQRKYRAAPSGIPAPISADQFFMLSEAIFLNVFRSYEKYIEEVFILFMLGKPSIGGRRERTCVSPRTYDHARELLKGGAPFLDWHSPDKTIDRSELFFDRGGRIKAVLAANRQVLLEMKRVRDRVAHLSREADNHYRNVLRARYLTIPPNIPAPGEFLQSGVRGTTGQYHLLLYMDELTKISDEIAR